jgi:hypothetical protein
MGIRPVATGTLECVGRWSSLSEPPRKSQEVRIRKRESLSTNSGATCCESTVSTLVLLSANEYTLTCLNIGSMLALIRKTRTNPLKRSPTMILVPISDPVKDLISKLSFVLSRYPSTIDVLLQEYGSVSGRKPTYTPLFLSSLE